MACTRGSRAEISSTRAPVPSGDPSSTTSTSSRGSCSRILAISVAMLSRSLYVGTMTSARSVTTAPPVDGGARNNSEQGKAEGDQCDRLPSLVRGARERELHVRRARGQHDADQRVVGAHHGRV